MKTYPYPIRYDTLLDFTHPKPGHLFHSPAFRDGIAMVCNGSIAIKCHRGLWASDDFPEAAHGFLERFDKIPLSPFPTNPKEWHALEPWRKSLFRRGEIAAFNRNFNTAPTPSVRVGSILVPLSMLQLISKLPRVEFSTESTSAAALFIRFNGGLAIIAQSKADTAAFTINPIIRGYDGVELPRGPKPSFGLPGWPPVDNSEF